MLRREHHEGRAVDGVDAGREHLDGIVTRDVRGYRRGRRRRGAVRRSDRESHTRALGSADPVALHRQHFFRPVLETPERLEQLVRIGGDAQEPLLQVALGHDGAAPPARPVDDLLVREHRLATAAPVDRGPPPIGQAAAEHSREQPLIPAVVVRQTRGDLALPGVADAQPLELSLHVGDVVERPLLGMHVVLDRRVLGGQTEGVPSERMQHVVAAHAHHPRADVADHVVAYVAHVRVARRVREHLEAIELWFRPILGHFERA